MLENFLNVARSQLGYKEGKNNATKYGAWYGLPNQPWCAMFVSWCANKSKVPTTKIPKFASSTFGMNWFKERKLLTKVPKSGYIGFVMKNSTNAEHTFIVEKVNGTEIVTIEGNLNDSVCRNKRKISTKLQFGVVDFDNGYTTGGYKLLYDKALRTTHAITLNTVKVKSCSSFTKKYLTSKRPNDTAKLKKGTECTIREIYNENGRIWGKWNGYWIVLCNKDGTPQATKI